jgi:Ca-activated chloride channel family protein
MLTFAYTWVLFLLPLPLLVLLLPGHRESRTAVRLPELGGLARLTGRQPAPGAVVARRPWLGHLGLLLVWVALLGAVARPQWVGDPIVKEQPTRDMLLAVDLSGSMETKDFVGADGARVERLTAVKQVLDEFLSRREGDRIGLIFFGTGAFVQAPFTADLDVVRALLDEAQVRMAGPKTAMGDAIGLALSVFERSEVEERVMIVLTDGNDTGSLVPPVRAAEIASDNDIVVHTVAVGDPAAAREEKLDEETLRAVAGATGGRYFFAADREQLGGIYDELDRLNPRQVETESYRPRSDLFQWPLGAALVLSLVWFAGVALRSAVGEARREAA